MIKYEVRYSSFLNKYAVINSESGVAQSFWADRREADTVARTLSRVPNAPIESPKPTVVLKVVKHLRLVPSDA